MPDQPTEPESRANTPGRLICWGVVLLVLLLSGRVEADDEPCSMGISAATTQRVFDTLHDRFPAGCTFDGVRTDKSELQVHWSAGGVAHPPIRITPRDCLSRSVGGSEFVVNVPPELPTLCPGITPLLDALNGTVKAEAPVGKKRTPPSPWLFVAGAAVMALIVPWSRHRLIATTEMGARVLLTSAQRFGHAMARQMYVVAGRCWRAIRRAYGLFSTFAATSRGQVVMAAAVAAGTAYWLNRITPMPWVDHDPTRDLLLVRDCLDQGRCQTSGPFSAVGDALQGAVWLEILTSVFLGGGATVAARGVVITLLALGVGTLFLIAWRWVRPAAALPAVLLALTFLSVDAGDTELVNPSTIFFPATIATGATLIYGLTGRRMALVIAAMFASHAAFTHTAGYALLPGVCLVAALGSPRPLRGLGLASAIFLATGLITSREALLWNAVLPNKRQWLWILPAGLVLVSSLGHYGRDRFARLGALGRSAAVAAALLTPFITGVLWLLASHHIIIEKYFLPIAAPMSLTAAGLAVVLLEHLASHAAFRWAPGLVPLALSGWTLWAAPRPDRSDWQYRDASAVAHQLAERGWTQSLLEHRIQGPHCAESLFSMMPFTPRDSSRPVPPSRQVRLWLSETRAAPPLPRGAEVISIGPSRRAIVSEVDSWLDVSQTESCRTALAPGFETECEGTPGSPDEIRPFRFSNRSHQRFPHSLFRQYLANRETFSIAIHPSAGETRELSLVPEDPSAPAQCQWHIVRVEGVETETKLPADHALLQSRNGTQGKVILERLFGTGECPLAPTDGGEFPCFLEGMPDDPPWVAASRRTPL